MTHADVSEAARLAYASGLCVVPPREDGTKAPVADWKQWQAARPTKPQMDAWYGSESRSGIGVITGHISRNLECMEFDDLDAYNQFREMAPAAGLGELMKRIETGYSEASPKGGVHWFYFCEVIEGNTKLASRPKRPEEKNHDKDNTQVMIETRGEGGFIVMAPSFGPVHQTGKPYVVLQGRIDRIATITPTERKELQRFARTFDQMPIKDQEVIRPRTEERTGKPGDDFNARATWDDVLSPHGWTTVYSRGGVTFWRRPGKNEGISATTNYKNSDLFYVWSSSTDFEPERGYSRFSVYSILNHNSDFTEAAKALGAGGYGDRSGSGRMDEETRNKVLDFAWSDEGNAELMAYLYGSKITFDWDRNEFFIWAKHRWERDPDGERFRMAIQVAKARQHAAVDMDKSKEKDDLLKYGRACESMARVKSTLEALRHNVAVKNRGGAWDSNPMLLGVQNGVIDLRTGTLRPGQPSDLITMSTSLPYDPEASCTRWEQYLREVFNDDEEVVRFIQRAVGYSLTGSTQEQVMFLCHGKGQNGKSIFLSILRALAGEYATNIASDTIRKKTNGSDNHPAEIAALVGRRVVTCSETPEAASLNDERIKGLVGGDVQTARFMRGNPFTFRPVLKLWLATNHLPRVDDDSEGFWRRMRLIPFLRQFRGAERDNHLEDKLTSELNGILAWAVRGAADWFANGLQAPQSVMMATLGYRNESDPLAGFISEMCIVDDRAKETAGTMFKAYENWALRQGYRHMDILNNVHFGRRMGDRFAIGKGHGGVRRYEGVRLRTADDEGVAVPPPDLSSEGWRVAVNGQKHKEKTTMPLAKGDSQNGVLPPPATLGLCVCSGRHGDDPLPCPDSEWWEDAKTGTLHCLQCHPMRGHS